MSSHNDARPSPTVIQWILDTRPLWPEATKTSDLLTVASRAMTLLTPDERANVLRFYFVRDAKLALGSALLKRHAIARFCGVPWREAVVTRDERTKPVFRPPPPGPSLSSSSSSSSQPEPLVFNVSHQAGLVVLFAVHNPPSAAGGEGKGFAIGVDVVCPGERRDRDHQMILKDSWPTFVDMHEEVFSPGETARLKTLAGTTASSNTEQGRDTLLAYFYTIWCLREAYIKMTGEALLAEWLRELELRGFAPPPSPRTAAAAPTGAERVEVLFRGQKVQDVDVKLDWLLDDYMVSTVVRRSVTGENVEVGKFESIDIEEVVRAAEEANR